jgi:hypothetical protein
MKEKTFETVFFSTAWNKTNILEMNNNNENSALNKPAVISRFSLWWIRTFKVISNQRAKELGLRHWRNVYGDEINHINCRSIWFDNKSRQYRVSHLEDVC